MAMTEAQSNNLSKFGFSFKKGAVHTRRTMMLRELTDLLALTPDINTSTDEYISAIIDENCTGKKSGASRKYTAEYLKDLYILDPSMCIFRALRFVWERDSEGQPLTAFICTYLRDSILRATTPLILRLPQGATPSKTDLHDYIDRTFPDRFSPVMTASLGRNLLSSWTQAGYLEGRRGKIRRRPKMTPGPVVLALFLGYLTGARGESLFKSEYAKLLDCPMEKAIELAGDASRSGWIVFKRVGTIIEVLFPTFLTTQEMEWTSAQS